MALTDTQDQLEISLSIDKIECYQKGPIDVCFENMPKVQWVSITFSQENRWLRKLKTATSQREFTLIEDWQIHLSREGYESAPTGTIVIPQRVDDKRVVFDGASIPLPWLVTFISGGLLRPLGLMLVASIVHDFAFKFGYLLVQDKTLGKARHVPVERHQADALFKDIIHSISEMPLVAGVAWVGVRLGWFFVKYNKKPRGGKPPVKATLIFFFLFLLIPVLLACMFGNWAIAIYFTIWTCLLLLFYALIWTARYLSRGSE